MKGGGIMCTFCFAFSGHYGAFLQDEWDLVFKISKYIHAITSLIYIVMLFGKDRKVIP